MSDKKVSGLPSEKYSIEQLRKWWNRIQYYTPPWAWRSDPYLEGIDEKTFMYLRDPAAKEENPPYDPEGINADIRRQLREEAHEPAVKPEPTLNQERQDEVDFWESEVEEPTAKRADMQRTKTACKDEAYKNMLSELEEIMEWALIEKAPLREQEINSIRQVIKKAKVSQ